MEQPTTTTTIGANLMSMSLFDDDARLPVPRDVPKFDDWWARYPRKVGKAEARRRWSKMSPAERVSAFAALDSWLAYYSSIEQRFVPHGSTWLNQARWEDDAPEPVTRNSARKTNSAIDALREMKARRDNPAVAQIGRG